MIRISESTMVVQLVVGGDGVQLHLLSEHTKPYVKAQLVGLLLGLVDTLKRSCTRTKAWKGGCGHKEGLFNNYLQDHSFGLGNLGHILLSTSQRLKGN